MSVGRIIAAATAVLALVVLFLVVIGVAATIPAWLPYLFIAMLGAAMLIG